MCIMSSEEMFNILLPYLQNKYLEPTKCTNLVILSDVVPVNRLQQIIVVHLDPLKTDVLQGVH